MLPKKVSKNGLLEYIFMRFVMCFITVYALLEVLSGVMALPWQRGNGHAFFTHFHFKMGILFIAPHFKSINSELKTSGVSKEKEKKNTNKR